MDCAACFMLMSAWHVRTQTVQQFTCGVGIAALNILEGTTAVDDQVFSPSAKVYKVQGAEEERLHNKVSVADSIHGVWAYPAKETQLSGNELTVYAKWIASKRTCKHPQNSSGGT